ncbi:SRPBCC family protein [Catelliglobosispora koreensis]|uniref:SRPBCC family protein n=1 Tax=Catelliglobosispora koreensis TaxID=129052 RepID=UPI00039DB930|nr:SRPBCC family protein [Catelliglobosispora koreensis]
MVALSGTLTVPLPVRQAFRLFTPLGEQDWVPHWHPVFPGGRPEDDTDPGTVFETRNHERLTTWVVVDREVGRRVRYARVIPQVNAGTVTVTLDEVHDGHSRVTVDYDLTALSDTGERELAEFASGYPAFLRSWETAIATALDRTAP